MKIDTDTEEGKAKLKELMDAETKGLKEKKEELLEKVKKQGETLKEMQDQLKEIQEAKDKAEKEAAEKGGDVNKQIQLIEKSHKKEIEKLIGERDTSRSTVNKLLIDNGLTDALSKANVAPQFMDAVRALIKTGHKAEVIEKDGVSVAHIDGKPLNEFVSDFAKGEGGKIYIAAPQNGGGGSNGSNGNPKGGAVTQMKESEFNAIPAKDRAALMEKGKHEIIPD